MRNVAMLSDNDRRELFRNTADKMGLHDAIVEKDFWVCFMLDHLFHDCKYKDAFVFKGGTSLMSALQEDYQAMRNMIYGNIPEFEEILLFLEKLQEEIHGLK